MRKGSPDIKEIDLAVVGGGIAGISAGIYACRAGLSIELFERNTLGGQLLYVGHVENYVGISYAQGVDILRNLEKSLKDLDIEPVYQGISGIIPGKGFIDLVAGQSSYRAKSLIISTGSSLKKLDINKEEEFLGKGISYCAVCDGFFFKNKKVAVVGGGNTACEEALYLSSICERVYLIHRRDTLRAVDYLQKKIIDKDNIEVVWNSRIKDIGGDNLLERVVIEDVNTARETRLAVNGLFIAIGVKPNTDMVKDVIECDREGFILTDEFLKTSREGIFACGDCRRRPLRQLITAAGEGAVAAMSAYRYLKGGYISG